MYIIILWKIICFKICIGFITPKASGWIETLDSGLKLGKVPSEVVEFFKNPEHEDTLKSLMDKVEPYWK